MMETKSCFPALLTEQWKLMMTSTVIVKAQSHPALVKLIPVIGGEPGSWHDLSPETQKFAQFVIPKGVEREFVIHSGQAVMVTEEVIPAVENPACEHCGQALKP